MTKIKLNSIKMDATEITPEYIYRNRRQFLKAMGFMGTAALLAACAPKAIESPIPKLSEMPEGNGKVDELGDSANSYQEITNYNNFYEFTTDKQDVALLSKDYQPRLENGQPFSLEISGLVDRPKTYTIEEIMAKFSQEERIYRLRCVEGWSMVIPWQGFPLAALLEDAMPQSNAKFVRFETVLDPEQMPGLRRSTFPWPYQEGLRLDEATHDLTILATGLYGNPLPAQNGMPIRLVVPWKYGFKSIKTIYRIELVENQPETFWNMIAPNEYGFYSNVNPQVDHPRWSQKTERRIGESRRRETLMFNGYEEEVADLYEGMDLSVYY